MARLLIAPFIVSMVSAFSSMASRSVPTRVSMQIDLIGSSSPLGFFDPLGFSKGADAKTLAKYRESELKHGRVAMMAVLGWLTQEKFHPFYNGKLSGNPLKAAFEVPVEGWLQIFFFCGIIEYATVEASKVEGYKAGSYYGLVKDESDPSWIDFQTRELNNGRLAMFAIIGEIAHSYITGKGALEQLGFTL